MKWAGEKKKRKGEGKGRDKAGITSKISPTEEVKTTSKVSGVFIFLVSRTKEKTQGSSLHRFMPRGKEGLKRVKGKGKGCGRRERQKGKGGKGKSW